MILSWWDAASKRWEYAWTADELEPAYEPRTVVAQPSSGPFSQPGNAWTGLMLKLKRGRVGGDLEHFYIFLDACTCSEIAVLMLIKWKVIIRFCMCLAVFLYVCDADERVREGFGQAGLAGEQTFAPGFYGTFWYNTLCGTDMIFLFFPLPLSLCPSFYKTATVCM